MAQGKARRSEIFDGRVTLSDLRPGYERLRNGLLRRRRSASKGFVYFNEIQCRGCNIFCLQETGNSNKSHHAFCSKKCRATWLMEQSDGNKIKKRVNAWGHYVLVKKRNHPNADKRTGVVREHVLVVESAIGRFLTKGEEVHHIDLTKSNNSLSNLYLCPSRKEHTLAHRSLSQCVPDLLRLGALRFDSKTGQYVVGAGRCP